MTINLFPVPNIMVQGTRKGMGKVWAMVKETDRQTGCWVGEWV